MSQASQAAIVAADAGDNAVAVSLARSGMQAGDADAVSLLAHWHLIGELVPRDLPLARTLLAYAAQGGNREAAATEIALTANGGGAPADWSHAHELLKRLASRGDPEAGRQIALLGRMNLQPDGGPGEVPAPELLGGGVRRWCALFTPEECAEIAMAARELMAPSLVADPATGRGMPHPIRTSSAAVIGPTRESLPLQAILRRIAAATGTDARQGEALTVLHYAPGQQYRPHMDTLPGEPNQRVATLILYLNQGYDGGETHFPATGLTVAPRAGDAICFANVTASGAPDPASRHAGLPVRRGTKWIATRWIRARAFDPWNLGRG